MVDLIKEVIGVFKGFVESGLEFKADIVVPYHTEYTPLLGSFLLVEVSKESYLLGRITKFVPVGVMSGGEAEDYLARMMKAGRPVPEDI
ncbi:MAG: ATPase, partial [Thermoplasmata archaeon]